MAKAKNKVPDRYSSAGYSDWGIKRLIREAENVARWNPWLAHAWMKEALDQISLDRPFFQEYDDAVGRINAYWKLLPKFRWYDEATFWNLDGVPTTPVLLKYTSDDVY